MNKKLKKNKVIRIACLTLLLTSCKLGVNNERIEETIITVVIDENTHNKLQYSQYTSLTIRENDRINYHLFGIESNNIKYEVTIGPDVEINLKDCTQILINKVPAKLISEKTYHEKNEKCIVRKYLNDIQNSADEKGYFFVLNQNRVVAFNSKDRNYKKFYEYENVQINKILKKDTSGFFYHHENEMIIE